MFPISENEFVINILISSIGSVLFSFFNAVLSAILGLPTS